MSLYDITPQEFQEIFGDLLADLSAPRYKGEKIQFSLKRGEHTYVYFQGKSGIQYCYTPHPSTKGDYFAWNYIPKGKGSRSGKASRFVLRDLVRCAKRKTAKAKALARYMKEYTPKENRKMNTYNEYPEINIPEFLKDWSDTSWHNDVTASSEKALENGNSIRVWVFPEDPIEREFDGAFKYSIILQNSAGDEIESRLADTDEEAISSIAELESINEKR